MNLEIPHLVSIRAWGDYACVTRPELKAERVSYSVLTPSAARGILEAIFYEPQIAYVVHEITVVRRGRWFSFRRNEVSKVVSLRNVVRAMTESAPLEPIQAGGGSADGTQRGMLALADVEYIITAEIRLTDRAQPPRDSLAKYAGMIERRARSGRCFHRPYLGVREFAANFDWVDDSSTVAVIDPWPRRGSGNHALRRFRPVESDQRAGRPGRAGLFSGEDHRQPPRLPPRPGPDLPQTGGGRLMLLQALHDYAVHENLVESVELTTRTIHLALNLEPDGSVSPGNSWISFDSPDPKDKKGQKREYQVVRS